MSDIKLPRMPNVQVPRIDTDVSLIDIRVLAKWCQRVAAEYARSAVEADRVERAQQDAPNLMEVRHLWDAATEATGGDGLEAMQHFARLVLARYAPAQDAERIDWLESQINEHGAIHLHDGNHPAGHGLGLRPGNLVRTLREAIDDARAQRADAQGDGDGR